jgi:deoxyribodipyrimidine photolyase-related protein
MPQEQIKKDFAIKMNIGLIFPHQLVEESELFAYCDKIVLIEEHLFFHEFAFHKQKIAFHRATMKAYDAYLIQKGLDVEYISSVETNADIRLLITHLAAGYPQMEVHVIDPTDNWLEKRVKESCKANYINLTWLENPTFINTKAQLGQFFRADKKSFFQTSFYKNERKRLNILMDADGNPSGGKWTFDTENRKKYPKNKVPPSIQFPTTSPYWLEAVGYVNTHFPTNPGSISEQQIYPLTHTEAKAWLQQFFDYRFHAFGDYEDAILKQHSFLNHSVLSPLLNCGLLTPQFIINQSLEFAALNQVPVNSLEGFVRQIIGWREFIRGMYEAKGSYSRTRNYWGFTRKIPTSFYDGTTGIKPVDITIKRLLKTGYNHHIERLMVLGNFMLLCEFDPDEVYRWFMEMYIDAYDWVMVPNVYGMSQFADGGLFATKPYISGSNYLKKMSDYENGEWQKIWDGLFWRFMHEHQDFFKKNPRTGMLLNTFNKMSDEKRKAHLTNAENFLTKLDQQQD